MEKAQFIEAGKIINTHGIAGEVKAEVWLDSPRFLKKFKRIFIRGREIPVISSREQKGFMLMKLGGVEDINSAMVLKESVFSIARADAGLPEGGYFLCDLIGAEVVDESGEKIGVLAEIMENPAQMIYVVKGESEHLIPAVPEFIRKVDADEGIITVRLIDGM